MARWLKPVVALVAVAAVAGASWWQVRHVRAARPRVWTEAVQERELVTTVTAEGTAACEREALLSAPDDGRVEYVPVAPGQSVRAGQVLVVLDGGPVRGALAGARAGAEAAAAEVRREEWNVERLEAERDRARQSHLRAEALFAAGTLSASDVARHSHDARIAELASAAAAEVVRAARARATLAGGILAEAEARASRRTIRAPADGVVLEVLVRPGEPVHGGGTHVPPSMLLWLGLPAVTTIEVRMDVRDAGRLRPGARASASIAALGVADLGAAVVAVDVQGREGASVVRARLDRAPSGLRPGMSATVRFTEANRSRTLAVPNHAVASAGTPPLSGSARRAVKPIPSAAAVWTVRDGAIALVPIVLGLRGDFYSEVLSGLTPGTLVVTGPAALIGTLGVGDRAIPVPAPIHPP